MGSTRAARDAGYSPLRTLSTVENATPLASSHQGK